MSTCENCGNKLRTCGKCGWSKTYEEDLSVLWEQAREMNHMADFIQKGVTALQSENAELRQEIERIKHENRELDSERVEAIDSRDEIAKTLGYTSQVCKEYRDEIAQLKADNEVLLEGMKWYADTVYPGTALECLAKIGG